MSDPRPKTEPVLRWTPAEAWLLAELAKRGLIATLDDGPPVRATAHGPFVAEIHAGAESIELELTIDADRATIALEPREVSGHRWRDGWALELSRGGQTWPLAADGAPIELADARTGPVRVQLRVRRRVFTRTLDGEPEAVPLTDVAFHRYTRQSTAIVAETEAWMAPTMPEAAPWWELDLGKTMWIAWIRIDLAQVPPGTRIVVRAYGFAKPSGEMWPGSVVCDVAAETLVHPWVVIEDELVARYVRVELVAPVGDTVVLKLGSAEVAAAELHGGTLAESIRRAFVLHHDRPLVLARDPDDGPYLPHRTYEHVWTRAMALARGLASRLERAPGDARVVLGVMTRNRAEWIAVEVAAVIRGYLVVAMSPDDSDERVGHVLAKARPACVICEAADADRLARIDPRLIVVACDDRTVGERRIGFDALVLEGAAAGAPPPAPRSQNDAYAVLFTSGSTGTPKGAVRSYRQFHAMISSYAIAHSPRHLSFQPLSHLSERMYLPALLIHGGCLAFSRGGAHLLDELHDLEPTTVGSVPRLFEVLYAAHQRRVRAAADASPGASLQGLDAASLHEARRAFGPRIMAVSVGSAPVSDEVLAFMRRCFADIWVSEGYGSTEVGSIAFDGKLADDVDVRLVPRPDAPAAEPGAPERGEIFVRTPHTISGYLGDPEATAAAIDADGYFATGDLGERDANGRVRVIGRVRNTVKLAQGEFVSIERIEVALATTAVVDRAYVHVAHGAPGFAALIVPHADALAQLLGVDTAPLAELVARADAAPAVLAELRGHGRRAGLAAYELPRAVLLVAEPLTVEAGLLTASGKLARGGLAERYGAQLAALAAAGAGDLPVGDGLGARLAAVASRVTGRPIDPREPLATGVAVDSLGAAELLEALSDELGREIPLAWWFEAASLDDLAARLDSGSHGAGAHAALAAADRALQPALATLPVVRPVRRVLLTGATGFLGAHLVEALRDRGIDVCCLVRADRADPTAAAVRLAGALARRGVPIGVGDHVRALAGDLAAPGLGLSGAQLDGIDAILHAGATVSWLAPYPALRAPNVLGTIALLELAAARGLPFHHVSTISTAPLGGDEASRLDFSDVVAATPYALSKWLAEDHVRRAGEAGVPVAIYRPAMIAGDTRRGIGNAGDFLNRYMAGCVELGLYVDRDDAIIDMTPVDFVAAAIAALVVAEPRGGGTYHLANVDRSPTFAGLGRAMAAAGVVVAPAPYSTFRTALLADRESRLHALAAFFPETFSLGMGPWPCARTDAALAALDVRRPWIDDAIIARYVAGLVATR